MRRGIGLFFVVIFMLGLMTGDISGQAAMKDVKEKDWYYEDLTYILKDSRQIIAGFPDGTFRPSEKLSVDQFITMVVRANGFFPSVKEGQRWSDPFIEKAFELELIFENDFLDYQAPITRGEMAKIVINAVKREPEIYIYRDPEKIKAMIEDYQVIGNGFKDACIKVFDIGIITGYPDGTFQARNELTRAEGTTVIRRLIDDEARKPVNTEGQKAYVYKVNPDIPDEVYEQPLKKQEWDGWYQTNKWMYKNFGLKELEEDIEIAKGYLESFYNVDYINIDQETFQLKVQWYFMPQIKWTADDRVQRSIEEHFSYWVESIKEKEIQMEMKFITDPSLVYTNGDDIIRGIAIFTVESCNDMEWFSNYTRFGKGIEVGKAYSRIAEIELVNMASLPGWDHASRVVSDEYFLTEAREVSK